MITYSSLPVIIPLILVLALGVPAQNSTKANDTSLFRATPPKLASSIAFSQNSSFSLLSHNANNPFSHLSNRQVEEECPPGYPVNCGDGECCPGGDPNCCGDGSCCPASSECRPDFDGCCPDTAETCGGKFCTEAGNVCCDTYVCPAGYVCSKQGQNGCCKVGELECSGGCCPQGTTCSNEPGFCQNSTVTNSGSCEGGLSKRQQSFGPNCETECHEGENLPVLNFHLKPGQTDGLYESMCKGMFERNGRQPTDKDVLNWGGSKDPNYGQRRKDAGCKGFCTEVNKFLPRSERVECDEYPPASTKQGGDNASRKCITWNQNSGYQGPQIKNFASKSGCNLQDNDRFIIRMKDGCSYLGLTKRQDGIPANTTLSARQNSPSQLSLSGSNDTLLSIDNSTMPKWISVHLDELQAGQYTVTVPLEFQITELVVLDGEGMEYASIESPSGSTTLNFTLDDDLDTGASLIAVTDRKMNISFTATAQLTLETAQRSNSASSLPLLASIGLAGYTVLFMELIDVGI